MNSGELKVDVPLAVAESDSEEIVLDSNILQHQKQQQQRKETQSPQNSNLKRKPGLSQRFHLDSGGGGGGGGGGGSSGNSIAASLEDLVNSFDEKLTACFQDYEANVDKIAPVQVRSQEEILNESQVWWTLTGNFGNMMPIDWSKSIAREKQLVTLNLCPPKNDKTDDLEDEDDLVAADLDMHTLILNSNSHLQEPVKTADEVIKEIDDIIDEDAFDEGEEDDELQERDRHHHNHHHYNHYNQQQQQQQQKQLFMPHSARIVNQALAGRTLQDLSVNELTQIYGDIEILVRELSEELVTDLGVRDELEFEKELKNTFISLLLSIQSKRRQIAAGNLSGIPDPVRARIAGSTTRAGATTTGNTGFKYLTTVIPYQPDRGPPQVSTLQVLVKILKAINEDSPAVPTLLTDYILKVLCPS